jgi:hypothetical protein
MQQTLMCVCCMYSTIDPDTHQLVSILLYLKSFFFLRRSYKPWQFLTYTLFKYFLKRSNNGFWSTYLVGLIVILYQIHWSITVLENRQLRQLLFWGHWRPLLGIRLFQAFTSWERCSLSIVFSRQNTSKIPKIFYIFIFKGQQRPLRRVLGF